MTTDYEKKYKEALERAKRFMSIRGVSPEEDPFVVAKELCEEIFPELAESEDERIMKVIHKILLGMRQEIFTAQDEVVTKDKALAYLKKQKEQKPTEVKDPFSNANFVRGYESGYADAKREQKPSWSEEDEKMLKNVLFVLESYVSQSECTSSPSLITTYPTYYKEIDWLKSLRPSWKPTEDEMEALKYVKEHVFLKDSRKWLGLKSLYDNLKKLM